MLSKASVFPAPKHLGSSASQPNTICSEVPGSLWILFCVFIDSQAAHGFLPVLNWSPFSTFFIPSVLLLRSACSLLECSALPWRASLTTLWCTAQFSLLLLGGRRVGGGEKHGQNCCLKASLNKEIEALVTGYMSLTYFQDSLII